MTIDIVQLTEASGSEVEGFLAKQGLSAEIVRWKYFSDYREDRGLRGYIARSAGRVVGFLGLVPFSIRIETTSVEAAWTCDWYVDDSGAKGALGLVILKHAMANSDYLFHLGGNELSQRILNRLALRCEPEAAVVYHLSLRVGDYLARARRRFGVKLPGAHWLANTPVRNSGARGLDGVSVRDGLPREVLDLLARRASGRWYPDYNSSHLQWLLEESPNLVCVSSWVQGPGDDGAVALFWAPGHSSRLWRMTAWSGRDSSKHLSAAVGAGVKEVAQRGAFGVRALAAAEDEALEACLLETGFSRHSRLPFHVLAQGAVELPPSPISGLSYLDQDLVYLFE